MDVYVVMAHKAQGITEYDEPVVAYLDEERAKRSAGNNWGLSVVRVAVIGEDEHIAALEKELTKLRSELSLYNNLCIDQARRIQTLAERLT